MKKISIIILLIVIALFSCDRRTSPRENLQNAISDFSNKQGDLETVTYYPERYTEVKTDSVIANTFKVKIKNYSLMDSEILLNAQHQPNKIVTYHRKFASDILVKVKSKEIFSSTLVSEQFENPLEPEFWRDATLEHVWVNQELSNAYELNLNITFVNPKLNSFKHFEMILDPEGNRRLYLKEEQS